MKRSLATIASCMGANGAVSFDRWLDECCVRDPMAHETTRDLYAAWTAWAERSGMPSGSEPKFRSALKARDFQAQFTIARFDVVRCMSLMRLPGGGGAR